MKVIEIQPLTRVAFFPYGEVIEMEGAYNYAINAGKCVRYHDLAKVETIGEKARAMISLLRGEPYRLPLELKMVERHPLGSQAFIPLTDNPFLVVVAQETANGPGEPLAFRTKPGQGVNIGRNVWHGILTPLDGVSDFAVVDRGGEGVNLEEHFFAEPFLIR
ncbi:MULTISPECIES: ureidoglycolate lyase [unclassified Rhizobium]|uniref:ureidoglycolate lyase n=1 Tax=unclassified Rhizobium TaxID=2613769 RepID=UPI00160CE27A|nr:MULTISPECIES: ureidoglycolate lyase [unclassified Rhizobium]MBB3285333.1 ureidoglycolate lyase [Rhizobium sp. BK252]MBB3400072.1 ureidoglycolate lyase [Rhizobium sp. BK289]MBB3412652.1 ureidoglycolate lyase [Rhizobium sp. BK284]MBB3480538.1 ureidoglycolate lyase [Rhizobium sp. BK347]